MMDLDPHLPLAVFRRLSGFNLRAFMLEWQAECDAAKASQNLRGIEKLLVRWAEIGGIAL